MAVQVGPFQLSHPIGRGGMATVWRGVHVERQVPVAVKIMTASRAQQPRYRVAFRDEVRAVARLHHPGIVMVFDCGEIDSEAADQSKGDLAPGSPYLAMELGLGAVRDVLSTKLSFLQQRTILLHLLDALAYAHARGVIHRDLKPANLLVVRGEQGPRIKVADFGLAHALDDDRCRDRNDDVVSGTPRFVAPEQILGAWRDQGPWTDLYALGCVAYWLAGGAPPHDGADTTEILHRHLREPLPPLSPELEVPPEFRQWVEQMLAKEPGQRFQRAADAAHALRKIGDLPGLDRTITIPFQVGDAGVEEITEFLDDTAILPELAEANLLVGPVASGQRPPLPRSWRHQDSAPPPALTAAGLGLFGLRQVPMVDRDEERDRIWNALRRSEEHLRPEVVVLRGPAGVGKSRLVQWVAERAHEVGGAILLKASHGPMLGPGDALSQMLADHLRCVGLRRVEILDRLKTLGRDIDAQDDYECLAITEIVAQTTSDEQDATTRRVCFSEPSERYVVLGRMLQRMALRRPIILWLDDVAFSSDSLHFVEYFLKRRRGAAPVLFLLTADDEDLDREEAQPDLLLQLEGRQHCEVVALGPLDHDDHLQVIQGLLALEDALAEDVARRTSGNPLFALQMVGDWVERGLLVSGPQGYRLQASTTPLPDDIHHLLVQRLRLILGDYEPPERDRVRAALELAAALGRSVDLSEWHAACRQLGLQVPMAAVEAMFNVGLAQRHRQGWSFTHDALRESFQRLAEDAGRWQTHHRACAEILQAHDSGRDYHLYFRLARHLWHARAFQDALQPMLEAARQARRACEVDRGYRLMEDYDVAKAELSLGPQSRPWVEGELVRASLWEASGKVTEARQRLRDVYEVIGDGRWPDLLAETFYQMGVVCRRMGAAREAHDLFVQGRDAYRRLGDWLGVAKCTHCMGAVLHVLGDSESAMELYRESLTHFESLGDLRGIALCQQGLGAILTRREQYDEARLCLEEALCAYEEAGDRMGLSNTLNSMGELNRMQGDFSRAAFYYRRAVATRNQLGTANYFVPQFNLAQCLLDHGDFEGAHQALQKLLAAGVELGNPAFQGIAHTGFLPCQASRGDWQAWDHHLDGADRYLGESEFVDKDLGRLFEMAAKMAADAGQDKRARAAAEAAARQWTILDKPERAASVLANY